MRELKPPKLTPFFLPEVRTLADMTPEERVALAKRYGCPLSGYDADGNPHPAPPEEKACFGPCADPYCPYCGGA